MHALKPRHPTEDQEEATILQIKLSEQGRIVILSNIESFNTVSYYSYHSYFCYSNVVKETILLIVHDVPEPFLLENGK